MTLPTAESVLRRSQWVALPMLITWLTPTVHAQAVPPPPDPAFTFDPNQNLEPTGGDLSLQLLEGILGSVISRVRLTDGLNASDAGPFGEMFSLFNGFLLFLLGILLFIKLVAALLDTAHEGEALGQDRSTTWTPIRIVLSASMLIPLVNGYSFIQVIVLWVTLSGVGLADAVWSTAVQQFTQTTLFAPPPPPQARQLAVAMLASNVCEQVVTALPARGTARYEVRYAARSGALGHYEERGGRWSVTGMGEAACGGFIIREPHQDLEPAQDATGLDALDGFLHWVARLFGFAADVRKTFATTLMAAHEQAALQLREELKPLAERIVQGQGALHECVTDSTGLLTHRQCLNLIDVAAEHYVAHLQAVILTAINGAGQRAFTEFTTTAQEEGWLSAGSWFYRLAALSEYQNKLALNVPEPYPIRAWEKLPREDVETYRHTLDRLTALLNEAETDRDAGLLKGDPNNSRLDDASRGFLRWTLDWIQHHLFGTVHPLFALASLGHALLAAVLTLVGATTLIQMMPAGKLATLVGGMTEILGQVDGKTGGALSLGGLIVGMVALALLAFALLAAIYIPLVPFIIWTMGALQWLLLVFEALVAAPLWAIGHLRNGKGFTAETLTGYLLLLGLLLRPTLMVFGLLAATIISYYLLQLISGLFIVAAINAASGNVTGPVMVIGLLVVFVLVAVDLTLKCFSLIHRLPDAALRWLGGTLEQALDTAELGHRSESALRAGVKTVEGGVQRWSTRQTPNLKRLGAAGSVQPRSASENDNNPVR
jgi:conjugal transfer/type IV secretion protein DotA/TraY